MKNSEKRQLAAEHLAKIAGVSIIEDLSIKQVIDMMLDFHEALKAKENEKA